MTMHVCTPVAEYVYDRATNTYRVVREFALDAPLPTDRIAAPGDRRLGELLQRARAPRHGASLGGA